ncbi:MAG: phytanoyl-CoA dioxygenase family protein [Polyangiales bacterium]
MSLWREVADVFGPRKDFRGPVLGNARLQQLGLHPARIVLSDLAVASRRAQLRVRHPALPKEFARDGVVAVPDVLPRDVFEAVRDEARVAVRELASRVPRPTSTRGGFGARRPFVGGFDRFDGATLNRFLALDGMPHASAAVRDATLVTLASMAAGFVCKPERFWIYETVQGDDTRAHDGQKDLHRDTFHSTVKLWLFLEDVRPEDGPFEYVLGSHRTSRARLRWERERAIARCASDEKVRGGAFRIDEDELAALGHDRPQPFPVKANTLVLADTRGFHRRGHAPEGAYRLSIYASLRSWPFAPFPY